MKRYKQHPAVRAEIRQAVSRYEDRRVGLGREFLAELKHGLTQITKSPTAFASLPDGPDHVRHYVVRRFPYIIIYAVDTNPIELLAVAHASRRPGYWLERLTK